MSATQSFSQKNSCIHAQLIYVANANGKNCISIIIPCHRLIGENKELMGYGGGLYRKAFLIELEYLYRDSHAFANTVSPLIRIKNSSPPCVDNNSTLMIEQNNKSLHLKSKNRKLPTIYIKKSSSTKKGLSDATNE